MYSVFVYGSLKNGFGNHRILRESEFLGKYVTIKCEYNMFSLGFFPGVTKVDKGNSFLDSYYIEGELYRVNDNTFRSLDILESNGSLYTREKVFVTKPINFGDATEAWMYLMTPDWAENDRGSNHKVVKYDHPEGGKVQSWT